MAKNLIFLTFAPLFIYFQILTDAQQVPCIFFFGDSVSDNGNNNFLLTSAKVNYPPYGIDYPGGFTGRFTNGQTIPDTIAKLVGFANPIPPFVSAQGSAIVKGVNYASGGAGILDQTGILLGQRFTLNNQLLNHNITVSRIQSILGNTPSANNIYMNKCLYVVNIGSNDYLNNYYLPNSPTRFFQSPDTYAQTLIQTFSQQLRILYMSGARKVAVFGIGLIGCTPQEISNNPTGPSGCVDFINDDVQLFNNRITPLIDSLNNNLPGAKFTYINSTNIALADPTPLGVRVFNAPCCQVQSLTGLCIPYSNPCSNRNEYIFWDNFHPTQVINFATAARAYNATVPADAYPVDIRRLIQ